MGSANTTRLHRPPGSSTFKRCVAKHYCPYGNDAHTDAAGIAENGGGTAAPNGRTVDISAMVDGVYTIGHQTYTKQGRKLTPQEVRRRKRELARKNEANDSNESSAKKVQNLPAKPPRAKPGWRTTNPKDFLMAETSKDPGILAQLAYSADWNVRLLVARNPATATDTLEQLATSADKNARLYRDAAHEELGYRYQDMRDAEELEACARMDADGAFQKRLETMPNYRQLAYMPTKRWNQKSPKARKTLLQAAMGEAGKMLKLSVRLAGWTRNKAVKAVIGSDGAKAFKLPSKVVYRSTLGIIGFMIDFFASLTGDAKAKKSVAKRLGFGW